MTVAGSPTLKLGNGGTATCDPGTSDLANGVVEFNYIALADPRSAQRRLSYHATGAHAGTLTVDDHGGHTIALNFIGDYTVASFQIDHSVTTHVDLLHV